jgi:hypothetical protein
MIEEAGPPGKHDGSSVSLPPGNQPLFFVRASPRTGKRGEQPCVPLSYPYQAHSVQAGEFTHPILLLYERNLEVSKKKPEPEEGDEEGLHQ